MEPKNRTSSQMSWFGINLPNWNEVHSSNGTNAGSNERRDGVTRHYNGRGEYTGTSTDDGRKYDVNGNEVFDDYDFYDD